MTKNRGILLASFLPSSDSEEVLKEVEFIANNLDLPNTKGYKYNPVGSYDQLDKFVERIGKPESICSMCPESRTHAIDHYAKGEVHVKHLD